MTLTTDDQARGPDDQAGAAEYVSDATHRRAARWFRHAPAERVPLAGIPAVWTAAEILHAAGWSPWYTGAAALAAAGVAFGLGERRIRAEAEAEAAEPGTGRPRLRGAELAAATAGVGAWIAAAAKWGPLAGPFDLLTLVYATGAACGWAWLRTHDAVRAFRARRDADAEAAALAAAEAKAWAEKCAAWHRLAVLANIPHGERSHLLTWDKTPLGESYMVKVTGTGQRASVLASDSGLAERLAELGGRLDGTGSPLARRRVEISEGNVAGRILIRVRDVADPWKHPIMHPMVSGEMDPAASFADLIPAVPSASIPVPVGVDPETAAPMLIPLLEAAGARHVGVFGTTGAGKTMLLDTCRVHFSAAGDIVWFQINLRKPRAERKWLRLAEGSALIGDPDAEARALAILDFLCGVITVRGQGDATSRLHIPTPGEPLYGVVIDEIAGATADPARKACIQRITQTGRENGVFLLYAGQRPVNNEIGGVTVRANTNFYVYGAMIATDRRRGSGSDEVALPDMGSYGEGAPGVFGVARMNAGQAALMSRGRGFFWGDDTTGLNRVIDRLAAVHVPHQPEPAIAANPRLMELWEAATGGELPAGQQYDLTATPDGVTVPGVAGVRGKLAAVAGILDGTSPASSAPPAARIAPEPAPAPAGGAERPAEGPDRPAVPPAPGGDISAAMATLRRLVARPGGVSAREAAEALPWAKTKAHELLAELVRQGAAEIPPGAAGSRRRFYAPGSGPHLRAVPDLGEDDDLDDAAEDDDAGQDGPGQGGYGPGQAWPPGAP